MCKTFRRGNGNLRDSECIPFRVSCKSVKSIPIDFGVVGLLKIFLFCRVVLWKLASFKVMPICADERLFVFQVAQNSNRCPLFYLVLQIFVGNCHNLILVYCKQNISISLLSVTSSDTIYLCFISSVIPIRNSDTPFSDGITGWSICENTFNFASLIFWTA